jgi:imidazolonepropionase-like amidohydrolase
VRGSAAPGQQPGRREDRIGSLTAGQDADVVSWSGDPLELISRAERAYVDGREIYRYDYERREGVFADR